MKYTAIKTVYLDGPKGENGKATQIVVAPGEDFEATVEVGNRLIERGKAGKRGEVQLDDANADPVQPVPAAPAKPAPNKR